MDLTDLIQEDCAKGKFRIHRSVYTSPEIMNLEVERLFMRSWIYVGHESELPKPGDYLRRTAAGRPIFMVHGRDANIRIFYNSCLHRGALICRQDKGRGSNFVCFYHGWSYDDQGNLIGVPDAQGYVEDFKKSGRKLLSPRNVSSYRGLYFVNFSDRPESLIEYLGEARNLMDLTLDSAEPLGGWRVVRGIAKFNIKANWKLLLENSVDNYHFHTTHRSFLDFMAERRKSKGMEKSKVNNIDNSRGRVFKNGHVAMLTEAEGRAIANPSPLWPKKVIGEVAAYRRELEARYGAERAREMSELSRFLMIFPNFCFHDTQSGMKFRQFWPVAPNEMEVIQWELVPRNENAAVAAFRLEGGATFQGPGGFGTPDDIEGLESCQMGFRVTELEWSDASRGMRRECRSDDELTSRGFWRQWHALMQNKLSPETIDDTRFDTPEKAVGGLV
jgi:p-cumate 2,3-dioxygenase subunit alpha